MPLFSQQGYQSFRKTVRTEVTLGSNKITANEGDTVVLTLNTKNIRTGRQFYYTVSGVAQEDLSSGSLSGTATVTGGVATITFTLANDVTFLEGPETLTVSLYRVVGGIPGGVPLGLELIPGVLPISVPVEDTSRIEVGEVRLTTSTTDYEWTVPAGVTSISIICVGSGGRGSTYYHSSARVWIAGSGGGGGGLGYRNNVAVTPGEILLVNIGRSMSANTQSQNKDSTVKRANGTLLCAGYGGGHAVYNKSEAGAGGSYFGDGGGVGGKGGTGQRSSGGGGGGGGAGGYSGTGGWGGYTVYTTSWFARAGGGGQGGGGAGGNTGNTTNEEARCGAGGGGVGIFGEGASGSSRTTSYGGGNGGSGGARGSDPVLGYTSRGGTGGQYGGGGGGGTGGYTARKGELGSGSGGIVRIIWPGDRRRFPSTNVGLL